jgi:hypothetical protein
MPESIDLPVYEMVRTHETVTDLWHEWSGEVFNFTAAAEELEQVSLSQG